MKGYKLTETELKGQIKDYLNVVGIFSYPLLQGLGSYAGGPDRIMHYRESVIYLEIKTAAGKLSPAQQAFKEQCERDKIPYYIIRSIEELISIIGDDYEPIKELGKGW